MEIDNFTRPLKIYCAAISLNCQSFYQGCNFLQTDWQTKGENLNNKMDEVKNKLSFTLVPSSSSFFVHAINPI